MNDDSLRQLLIHYQAPKPSPGLEKALHAAIAKIPDGTIAKPEPPFWTWPLAGYATAFLILTIALVGYGMTYFSSVSFLGDIAQDLAVGL